MPTILVVDDDDAYRTLISVALADRGFETVGARTAEEALFALSGHAVDAAVTDIRLPGLDGNSLIAEIRRRSQMPIVAVSGADETEGTNALQAGASGFMAKPISADELSHRLRSLLDQTDEALPRVVQVGALAVRLPDGRAEVAGRPLDLAPAQQHLLALLVTPPLQVRSAELLHEQVFGPGPTDRARLEALVDRLRVRLDAVPAGPRIVSVSNGGYRYEP